VQATSWTLKEALRFDAHARDERWLGGLSDPALLGGAARGGAYRVAARLPGGRCGRSSAGPGDRGDRDAVYDALGVRVRDLPLTADRIRAAMA